MTVIENIEFYHINVKKYRTKYLQNGTRGFLLNPFFLRVITTFSTTTTTTTTITTNNNKCIII